MLVEIIAIIIDYSYNAQQRSPRMQERSRGQQKVVKEESIWNPQE